VVGLACHAMVGEKHIKGRQYELDDTTTNVPVVPERFTEDCLEDRMAFEVAMKFARMDEFGIHDCPRCGFRHPEDAEKLNGWMKWYATPPFSLESADPGPASYGCKTKFNSHISAAPNIDTRR
jgi:hypothetical protein